MLRSQHCAALFASVCAVTVLYLLLNPAPVPATAHMGETTSEAMVVVYNRVPKTGSTTVMNVLYRLAKVNGFTGELDAHWSAR